MPSLWIKVAPWALLVVSLFSVFYLGEALRWTTFLGFGFIFVGVAIVMFFR